MRIAKIEFLGFRGALNEVSIDVPRGFAVIVGRNGTGKSTVCDAIEYAISGTIRGPREHKEKREGIHDYIWWCGDGTPASRYVRLVLENESGKQFTITRTPLKEEITDGVTLESLLCANNPQLDLPLTQLCRTTILRDEEITHLSVDLKETERFDFVRAIIGSGDFSDAEMLAKNVLDLIKSERDIAERNYSQAADTTSRIAARLSRARTELASSESIADAESYLRQLIGTPGATPDDLTAQSERLLADKRLRVDALVRLYTRLQNFEKRSANLLDTGFNAEKERLVTERAAAEAKTSTAQIEWEKLLDELDTLQKLDPVNASLAQLSEHGEQLGLINGKCPLCGLEQTHEHFVAQIAALKHRVNDADSQLSAITGSYNEAETRLSSARAESYRISALLNQLLQQEAELIAEEPSIASEAVALGLQALGDKLPELTFVENRIEEEREQTVEIERGISILHASRAAELVTVAAQELKVSRNEMEACERRLSRVTDAHDRTKKAFDTVRRAKGEFINDQLAQLEPLLIELYKRLKPHIDWPEIRYFLRGDVRRMLSLEVGNGINPSFIFSSGQRRAAGLAFLLALHLSRNWCSLKTLVLDDPVQHIDDYRALHLTEVLASIRRIGRQVICTIEDEALAQLLARRLRTDSKSGGCIVHMGYSSIIGIHAQSVEPVSALPISVLLPA